MKIRDGFVSNSSSSSFIVRHRQDWFAKKHDDTEPAATKEQVKALLDLGFKWTREGYPSQLENCGTRWCKSNRGANFLGFQVGCNQDEVIEFLVRNGIPFQAACHYGHYHVFYDGKGSKIITVPNDGLACELYGVEYATKFKTKILRQTEKQVLAEADRLHKELEKEGFFP